MTDTTDFLDRALPLPVPAAVAVPEARAVPPMPPMRAVPPMPPAPSPFPASVAPQAPAAPQLREVPPVPPMPTVAPTPPMPTVAPMPQQGGQGEATKTTELILAEALADLMQIDQVPIDSDFFDDLGADSMVMARFCARVRKRPDLPSVSMRDIYENSTIGSLATAVAQSAPAPMASTADSVSVTRDIPVPAGKVQYAVCGTLQLLFFLGYSFLGTVIAVRGFFWTLAGSSFVDVYLRSVALTGAAFVTACVIPVVAKWVLVGRWKPRPIRIWSLAYFRFWVVKTLIRSNPIVLLNGRSVTSSSSPIYTLYLRALGAKIGRGVTILSTNVPVCTDLLTIGDHTVVRKDAFLNCYRARAGVIEPGAVTLGKHALVGEATVLDINTMVADGAQLGHASSLQSGQIVPPDARYQGAPAQPTEVDYRTAVGASGGVGRQVAYAALQLINVFALSGPLTVAIAVVLTRSVPELMALVRPASSGLSGLILVRNAMVLSALLLFGSIIVGLFVAGTVPRFLKRLVKPGRVYPLYGVHYVIHRLIARLTNVQFFTILFGDSSFIVHYLRWIGYDLNTVEQTGSNFGTSVKHETPFLTSVGSGTVVADGLSVINADFSSTSFQLAPVSIGSNNFLGNNIAYPSRGVTGDDCLLATKVAVPIAGETRQGVGLLGSPNFEIPRSVDRDRALEIAHNEELLRPLLLTAKNRHNLVTMGLYLLLRWVLALWLILLLLATMAAYEAYGAWAVAAAVVVSPLVTTSYWVLVQKAVNRLQALEPDGCSIYHRNFWRHERYWKLPAFRYVQLYNGTPFKTMIWRLLGARIGARVFDDGCFLVEKSFVTIGDDCTLNAGSIVQCHSQEDGGFKSDRTVIEAGCTLGVGAFVHYGVSMGPESVLATDSFLMKGQETSPQTVWVGNPAQEISK